MTNLILALASAGVYGAADFCGGLASRRAPTLAVVVWSQLAGWLLLLLAIPILPAASPQPVDFAWGAAAGVSGGVGVALLYRALATGTMSIVAPVTAVCAALIPVAVGLLRGEKPSALSIAGIAVALLAIALVSQSGEAEPQGRGVSAILMALGSGVAIGIFLVMLERTGAQAGLWPLLIARPVSMTMFTIMAVVTRSGLRVPRESVGLVGGGGALDMLANALYLLAVRGGHLSLVATLSSLYPAATAILARFILGERLRRAQRIGMAMAIAAILMIVGG